MRGVLLERARVVVGAGRLGHERRHGLGRQARPAGGALGDVGADAIADGHDQRALAGRQAIARGALVTEPLPVEPDRAQRGPGREVGADQAPGPRDREHRPPDHQRR